MYQTRKTYVKPEMKMATLIFENPSLLMLLEHFKFDLVVHDYTVEQLSNQYDISPLLLVTFCNLYNGFTSSSIEKFTKEDVEKIIFFLRNSHHYYKTDKYPEIKDYIDQMNRLNSSREMKMVEHFFDDYFNEVNEHLNYEEQVAFPEICLKLGIDEPVASYVAEEYSVSVYRDHHTDIESKLSELRNLLLKYIPLNDDRVIRRKLLISLFELEFDLSIHSLIEEAILIPLVRKFETWEKSGK